MLEFTFSINAEKNGIQNFYFVSSLCYKIVGYYDTCVIMLPVFTESNDLDRKRLQHSASYSTKAGSVYRIQPNKRQHNFSERPKDKKPKI